MAGSLCRRHLLIGHFPHLTAMDRSKKNSDDVELPVSRRDFVARAGQLGALTVLGSQLDKLAALPVHMPPSLLAAESARR